MLYAYSRKAVARLLAGLRADQRVPCLMLLHSLGFSSIAKLLFECAEELVVRKDMRRALAVLRRIVHLPRLSRIDTNRFFRLALQLPEPGRIQLPESVSGNALLSLWPATVALLSGDSTRARQALQRDWERLETSLAATSSVMHDEVSTLGSFLDRKTSSPVMATMLARLAFSLGAYPVAVRLYALADASTQGHDRIALLVATSRMGGDAAIDADQYEVSSPDWNLLLAEEMFRHGNVKTAVDVMKHALLERHADHPEGREIAERAVKLLQALGQLGSLRASGTMVHTHPGKLFVCGLGWSGSGAVYDALRDRHGLREFPLMSAHSKLLEDARSEVQFIQGPYGLGAAWLELKKTGVLQVATLRRMFFLHVVGGAWLDADELKCVMAARACLKQFGLAYLAAWEALVSALRGGEPVETALADTVEALCGEAAPAGETVLFNNGVFGRNLCMLEMLPGSRVAVVFRDPRDVCADRKLHDRRNQKPVEEVAEFYLRGVGKLIRDAANLPVDVRAVPFEKFVEDSRFRDDVMSWALGEAPQEASKHFDPSVSERNIGMHVSALSEQERHAVERLMKAHRWDRMLRSLESMSMKGE